MTSLSWWHWASVFVLLSYLSLLSESERVSLLYFAKHVHHCIIIINKNTSTTLYKQALCSVRVLVDKSTVFDRGNVISSSSHRRWACPPRADWLICLSRRCMRSFSLPRKWRVRGAISELWWQLSFLLDQLYSPRYCFHFQTTILTGTYQSIQQPSPVLQSAPISSVPRPDYCACDQLLPPLPTMRYLNRYSSVSPAPAPPDADQS